MLKEIVFAGDELLGNFESPVVWTKSDQIEQDIPLRRNWNWIAFGVDPAEKSLWKVFEPVSSWASMLKTKNEGMSYCNGTEWKGSLDSIAGNKMYKPIAATATSVHLGNPTSYRFLPQSLASTLHRERYISLTAGTHCKAYAWERSVPLYQVSISITGRK